MRTALAVLTLSLAAALAAAEAPKSFLSKWSDVQRQAAKLHKPIYLHFTTTWCGWCRKIEKDTYGNPAGAKALTDFVCASLDCTVAQGTEPKGETKINMDLMTKYGGNGYPYLVMLTPDGKTVLNTISGYLPVDQFVRELTAAKQTAKDLAALAALKAKGDTKSYEYTVTSMRVFNKTREPEKAQAAAEKVLKLDPKNAKGDAAEAKFILLEAAANDAAKAKPLIADIRKLDSMNEKGYLEKALLAEANIVRGEAGTHSPDEQKKDLKKIQAIAIQLNKLKNLQQPQLATQMLLFTQLQLEQWDDAIATANKMIKTLGADSEGGAQLKQLIEQIKQRRNQKH